MDIYNIVKFIPEYSRNYYENKKSLLADLEWNPSYFIFKLILSAKTPVAITREYVRLLAEEYNTRNNKAISIENLFQKGWLREVIGRVFIVEYYYHLISYKDEYVSEDFYDELLFGEKIKEVFYGDLGTEFIITEENFNDIYNNYKQVFPAIPNIDILQQRKIVKIKENGSFAISLDMFRKNETGLCYEVFAKIGAYYWHHLLTNDSNSVEQKIKTFLYVLRINNYAPCGFSKYLSEEEADIFCTNAIELIKKEPDLYTNDKEELQKVILDGRILPEYYDKDLFIAELDKIKFSDLFSIYYEIFVLKREQPYIEYFVQDARGDISFLLSEIINTPYTYKVSEYCKKLLEYYNANAMPFVFYNMVFTLKSKPKILPYLLNDVNYGHIILLIINELLYKQSFLKEPLLIPENLWEACLDYYFDYISRLYKPKPNVPKIVTQFMMVLIHQGLFFLKSDNKDAYLERVKKSFQTIAYYFTSKNIPVRFNFVPVCNQVIKEIDFFDDVVEKLWLEVFIFDYLSTLPESADETNLIENVANLIEQNFLLVLNDDKLRFYMHDIIYAIDFSMYIKWLCQQQKYSKEFLEIIQKSKFSELTKDCVRLQTKRFRCILILFCSVNEKLGNIARNERSLVLIDLLRNCFYDDLENYCVNCFGSIDEKYFLLLPKVVRLMKILTSEDLIDLYTTIVKKITPDVLIKLYNLTESEALQKILLANLTTKSVSDFENSVYNIDDLVTLQIELLNAEHDMSVNESFLEHLSMKIKENSAWTRKYENTVAKMELYNAYKKHDKDLFSKITREHPNLRNEVLMYNAAWLREDKEYDKAIAIYNQLISARVDIENNKCALLYTKFSKIKDSEENKEEGELDSILQDIDDYLQNFTLNQNIIQALLYVKIYSYYLLKQYDKSLFEFEKNKDFFETINTGIEEIIIKQLLIENRKEAAHALLSECLQKYTDVKDQEELRALFLGYDTDSIIQNLKESYKEILILDDNDKFKILPKKINDHQDDKGLFVCNIITCSLLSMKNKFKAINSLKTVCEDYFNDILQVLMNSYLKVLGYSRVSDQNRTGISPTGKNAGEADLTFHFGDEDLLIEALRLSSLDTKYLNEHELKVFNYGVSKKLFFIVIYYQGNDFLTKKTEIFEHIKTKTTFPRGYELNSSEEIKSENSIAVLETMHTSCQMYHIVVDFGEATK